MSDLVTDDAERICPAKTPGTTGVWDQADPDSWSMPGMSPGPNGVFDYGTAGGGTGGEWVTPPTDAPDASFRFPYQSVSGSIAVGGGAASVVRIPVPGASGLYVELSPRGWTPKAGTTSTLFVQDSLGKQHLRLDYGYNARTGKVDYHWNVGKKGKGFVKTKFKVSDHGPVGPGGPTVYRGAKFFRYAGRTLLVVGIAADVYSVVVAKNRWRQSFQVASGWAGAWVGCKVVGAGGAALGTLVEPGLGTAVGGVGGCVVGGVSGYFSFSQASGEVYDWVEETYFDPLPEYERSADVVLEDIASPNP